MISGSPLTSTSLPWVLIAQSKDAILRARERDYPRYLQSETDQRIFTVLTNAEREGLAAHLWELHGRVLENLGIPEWHLSMPHDDREG
jgi:hypothetical protein